MLQIYVRASMLCRFHSHSLSGTNTPSIAFRHLPPKEYVTVEEYAGKRCGSVGVIVEEGAGNRCWECVSDCGGRCRKAMLGVCE